MEFTAIQIAAFLQGEVIGDGNVKVRDLAKIEEGREGCLSFLANPKYTEFLYTTESSIVLLDASIEIDPAQPVKATMVKVANARAAMGMLLNMVQAALNPKKTGIEQPAYIAEGVEVPADAYVGAFAYVGKGATIGEGSQIYPQVYLGENVKVGKNCIIYAGVKVYHDCVIGDNSILHSGCVIGADGFGFAPVDGQLQKISQIGNVILEGDNEIGANTTIDRAEMESTIIGKGVKIDNLCQIAHNVEIGDNTVMAAQCGIAGSTKIGKNCIFGGQVGIAGHLTIADNTTIGAQAGIIGNIKKSGEVLLGSPAMPVKNYMKSYAIFKRAGQE